MADTEGVAAREWTIESVSEDWVRLSAESGEKSYKVPRHLLGDDVEAGDRFRVVATLDRSGRGDLPEAWTDAVEGLESLRRGDDEPASEPADGEDADGPEEQAAS